MLRVFRNRRGTITLYGAVMFPILIGMTGLGTEYAYGLLQQAQDQRAADVAAYGGALAYNATSDSTAMTSAANRLAAMNGYASSHVTAALLASPTGSGNQSVQVTVTSSRPVVLSKMLGAPGTMQTSATSYVELKASAPACVVALSGASTGVTLSGGTALSAPACAIASNASVSVPCGTTVTTVAVLYNGAVPSQPCSGIQPPSGKPLLISKKSSPDPLAANTEVAAATGHIPAVAALTSPAAPSLTGGTAVSFAYSSAATITAVAASGCTASFASPVWTVTCVGNGPFTFGNITTGGGITVNFNTAGSASAVYNFNGSITMTGTALHFGPGTYNISGGLKTGGGTTTTFGAGNFNIGPSASTCSDGSKYSICHTGTTLTFAGPSDFALTAGLYASGGTTMTLGSGTTNSYLLGASSNGNALTMGGGANVTMADATGSGDVFQMNGNLNVASGGGSCLTVPAATQHDINGFFATAGGTNLGSGVYTVNGYVSLGGNGGGDVTCAGVTVGMSAPNVTFVISGISTPAGGTCAGQVFCVGAGYGHVTLTAPTTGTLANLAVVGPIPSAYTGGATFTEGASNTMISGVFYIPNGQVNLSGGANVGSGAGQCLELIGISVTLSGGTTLATACSGLGGSAAVSTVLLVQ